MVIMRRLHKGTNSPNVRGGRSKVKKKFIDQKQRRDTASKGVGAAYETIRQSIWHRQETRRQIQQLMESICVLGPHRRRGV